MTTSTEHSTNSTEQGNPSAVLRAVIIGFVVFAIIAACGLAYARSQKDYRAPTSLL